MRQLLCSQDRGVEAGDDGHRLESRSGPAGDEPGVAGGAAQAGLRIQTHICRVP